MSEPYELCWLRLPLEGACNVRELGGYPVQGGGQTRYHRFLRSDWLWQLTDGDCAFLYDYGVRAVIDLRDPSEVQREPDRIIGPDVVSANYPLLALDLSNQAMVDALIARERPTFTDFYDMVLQARDNIAACFRFIAEAPEGCVLFHCMAGKDRTGVLALLLMSLAGCDKWDCVSSYMQSRVHMMRNEGYALDWAHKETLGDENFSDSPVYAVEHVWDQVQKAGGAAAFVRSCGVTDEELAAVRARLLGA